MLLQESVAAATAIVGYDLLAGSSLKQSNRPRRIVAAGLAGSAAALDTKADIFVDQVKVGSLYNSSTGATNRDDMYRIGTYVAPGAEVHAYVTDAPVTNPINITLDFAE